MSRTNGVQDKRKHRKCEHFFELQQMLKMSSTRLHVFSQPFLKRATALFCGKNSHVLSSATFNSETVFGFE